MRGRPTICGPGGTIPEQLRDLPLGSVLYQRYILYRGFVLYQGAQNQSKYMIYPWATIPEGTIPYNYVRTPTYSTGGLY